jgi:hypothetical protein
MKTRQKIDIFLRCFILFTGLIPAAFLCIFSSIFLLIGGIIGLNLLSIIWGVAALAGTWGLLQVVSGAPHSKHMVGCLLSGLAAIAPLVITAASINFALLPALSAVVYLIWMLINFSRTPKPQDNIK